MTDIPTDLTSVPARIGVEFAVVDGQLVGSLLPHPGLCERGLLPIAALVYLSDAVAGITIDTDPDTWAFTSQLSVRRPLVASPRPVEARTTTLRGGSRSTTCEVALRVDGAEWGTSIAGFARVPRREGDPPKVMFDLADVPRDFGLPPLEEPLRRAAGFESVDPASGIVRVALSPAIANPAGAMQGGIVAGLAEAAAEDLADHHRACGTDRHAVSDIEVFYLAQNRVSPIATRARFVGPPDQGTIRVDLVDDDGRGRVTTAVVLRVGPAPG
ncbi:hypothetical protein [Rhabdothermincola salaria]|uniref:hypothetical protein n=1 Tax=Rhabdothermincola salaria TaxID=2903142 RepID=UPI001E54B112|nr:hypothetical protein [Rhabdothermincola salaria]MCD9623274.1 hypothetical protein [Rhabdothermincola salaria]